MRWLLPVLLVALAGCSRPPASTGRPDPGRLNSGLPNPGLPNPTLTPGRTTNATREDICKPGYTRKVRSVSESLKRRIYSSYGRTRQKGVCCEVDHLIPLELGGANSKENLWPQPWNGDPARNHPDAKQWGAKEKDQLENRLHRLVCSGKLDLPTAQQAIAHDWVAAWEIYVRK